MRKLSVLLLSILFISFIGCKNDDGGTEPITKANISGEVNLYDAGTTEVDNSGMTIYVEGVTPEISAVTDADGKFTLKDVPFATYNLTYDKTGYGTYRLIGVEHKSTTSISAIPSLGQFSTTHVTHLNTNTAGDIVTIEVTADPPGSSNSPRYLRYFYSSNSSVDDTNYEKYSETFEAKINPSNHTISKADLINMGFASGTTVYVKVYGDSFYGNAYEDPDSGKMIFPNLNANSVDAVSFLVP